MTASILHFPDIHERNDREFERTGTTPFTRAVDEAHELSGMPPSNSFDRQARLSRIAAVGAVIARLTTWRDEVDGVLPIRLHSGALANVSLREAPRFLRELMNDEMQ